MSDAQPDHIDSVATGRVSRPQRDQAQDVVWEGEEAGAAQFRPAPRGSRGCRWARGSRRRRHHDAAIRVVELGQPPGLAGAALGGEGPQRQRTIGVDGWGTGDVVTRGDRSARRRQAESPPPRLATPDLKDRQPPTPPERPWSTVVTGWLKPTAGQPPRPSRAGGVVGMGRSAGLHCCETWASAGRAACPSREEVRRRSGAQRTLRRVYVATLASARGPGPSGTRCWGSVRPQGGRQRRSEVGGDSCSHSEARHWVRRGTRGPAATAPARGRASAPSPDRPTPTTAPAWTPGPPGTAAPSPAAAPGASARR